MRSFGFLFVMAVALMTLASSTCKKRPLAPVELPDQEAQIKGATKGQFRMTFKYNTEAGPIVPFASWVVATTQIKMFSIDGTGGDEGTCNISGSDTTKQLEPGKYHILGWGDWNGDSIGGFKSDVADVELQAGTKPKNIVIALH